MQDPHDAFDAAVNLEMFGLDRAFVADHADDRALFAAREMRLETKRFDVGDDLGNLFSRRIMLHNDDHGIRLLVQSVGEMSPLRDLS